MSRLQHSSLRVTRVRGVTLRVSHSVSPTCRNMFLFTHHQPVPTSHHSAFSATEARGYTAAPASRLYIDYTSHNRHTSGRCHAPCHDDESPRVTNVSIPHLIVLHICTVYSAALYSSAVLYSAAAHDWHWHCFVLSRVFLDAISISGGVAVRALLCEIYQVLVFRHKSKSPHVIHKYWRSCAR